MNYKDLITFFKSKTNIDLSLYKEQQMKRRIETFMEQEIGSVDYVIFINTLSKDSTLMKRFKDRITINVTEFYRNMDVWDSLRNKIIPEVSKGKTSIKVWSAGCSTGEEPYSLAILLAEDFPKLKWDILATDLDETVLNRSKRGVYSQFQTSVIKKNLIDKYFESATSVDIKETDGFFSSDKVLKVSDNLKKNMTFKQHNLLADKFPQNVDLILCRNVVIYFTEEAKSELYERFNKALRPGGIILIGNTEHIVNFKQKGYEKFENWSFKRV